MTRLRTVRPVPVAAMIETKEKKLMAKQHVINDCPIRALTGKKKTETSSSKTCQLTSSINQWNKSIQIISKSAK